MFAKSCLGFSSLFTQHAETGAVDKTTDFERLFRLVCLALQLHGSSELQRRKHAFAYAMFHLAKDML